MLSIENARPDDLARTAALHKDNLRLGLFPRLGRGFLRRYQETFAKSPYGIALVARSEEDEVVGALFATTDNADHYRWVVKNCGWELAVAGSGALAVRPHLAWTFASTRMGRYMRGLRRHLGSPSPVGAAGGGSGTPLSVLSHIVTAPDLRRCGVGKRLVEEFKARARAKGVARARLVTEEGGDGAPFFERLGCTYVTRRAGEDGRVLREYRLIVDEAEAGKQAYEGTGLEHRDRGVAGPYHQPHGPVPVYRTAEPG